MILIKVFLLKLRQNFEILFQNRVNVFNIVLGFFVFDNRLQDVRSDLL